MLFKTFYTITAILGSIGLPSINSLLLINSHSLLGNRRICRMNMKSDKAIVLFTPNCMRIHDNPALIHAENRNMSVFPIFIDNSDVSNWRTKQEENRLLNAGNEACMNK